MRWSDRDGIEYTSKKLDIYANVEWTAIQVVTMMKKENLLYMEANILRGLPRESFFLYEYHCTVIPRGILMVSKRNVSTL